MPAPLIFMDTETTGLEPDADVWEFGAIRRQPDGEETELHLFIEHDERKCRRLPEAFLDDHLARFPGHGQEIKRKDAAHEILRFTNPKGEQDKPHIVGAVPNFDTERLTRLIRTQDIIIGPGWHYHLIDVENLAVGWLASNRQLPAPQPPWDSDELSRNVGVDPAQFARHTAIGDAEWARAIYDAVMGGAA